MRLHSHIDVNASAADCFDLSQDYALRPLWDSLTPKARTFSREAGEGGSRVAAFRLLRGPWWFAALAGSWRFVPHASPEGAARCPIHFTYHLRLHRAVAWLLNPLVRAYVQRQSRQRLRALKRLAENRAESCTENTATRAGGRTEARTDTDTDTKTHIPFFIP